MLGATVGPYRIEELIGRGGMGEVYRAHDSRLDRDVALKVLPRDFADDDDRRRRFEREARLLASLQHQNIASIYGFEELDNQPVLVMELAAGDDLSVRLGAGPLDIDEVERIASRLARGIEFAHERGIVHRDLKPANIKLGLDGRVKILDFGLARAFDHSTETGMTAAASAAGMSAVTHPAELTGIGTVLGTPAYMSPEQARGYTVDRRTDIWAYGVILFEMLTGRRLFQGESRSDVLASVLRERPDFDSLPAETPPLLRQLIRRCLEKDPRLRLRDMGEVRIALDDSSSSMLSVSSVPHMDEGLEPAPTPKSSRLPWLVSSALALALVAVSAMSFLGRPDAAPLAPAVHSQITLPEGMSFHLNPAGPGPPVVSPDGRYVAFSAADTTGQAHLYLHSLADQHVRVLAGTQGAAYPFWSPNSDQLGFFANENLNRVDINGGPVVPICDARNGKGGAWSRSDMILFTPSHSAPIHQVAASGGESMAVTSLDTDVDARSHRFPCWLPDGRHFIYLSWRNSTEHSSGQETVLILSSLDGEVHRELIPSQTNCIYADGRILYVHEEVLMSRAFDADRLEFTGTPQPLVGGVLGLQGAHAAVFSATDNGVLSFVSGGIVFGQSRLEWLSPDGSTTGEIPGIIASSQGLTVSPDGSRICVSQVDLTTGTFDLWLKDTGRDAGVRFTYETGSEIVPVWSRDGQWIAYAAERGDNYAVMRLPASGAGRPEMLVSLDEDTYPHDWSRDGRRLLFSSVDADGDFDLWLFDMDQPDAPTSIRATAYSEANARFSPDENWIAYNSTETGQWEVFVESLADGGGRYRISSDNGGHPFWSPDGTRLYYLDLIGRLMVTEVALGEGSLSVGATTVVTAGLEVGMSNTYALDPASGSLAVQRSLESEEARRLQVVTGWPSLALAPGGI